MIEQNQISQSFTHNRMRVFILIWFGQVVSIIGSGVTSFALSIWVYQYTGSVTKLALTSLLTILPTIVISPIAGAIVDRWNQRWILFLSDLGAGLSTAGLALILLANHLEIWHIYLVTAIHSICGAFQSPAYTTAMTLLVPKEQLGRANGLIHLGQSMTRLISPVLAGALIVTIQLQGIILFDLATFVFALVTLLYIRFPKSEGTANKGVAGKGSLLFEVTYAWIYIKTKPGILGLMVFVAVINFLFGIVEVLAIPLVLSFTSAAMAGILMSIGGSGMVFGSLVMSIWGGSQRSINNLFCFMLLSGLCILVVGLQPNTSLIALAAFFFFFSLPIMNGSIQVILQRKVMLDVQGRVFALTGMIAAVSLPLAYLVAGPLADYVFEPLMAPGSFLTGTLGQIIGTGPGRGISLMFIVMGVLTIMATMLAYQYLPLRLIEKNLPDRL